MSEQEKARAVIYGIALGDAFGWPVEFLSTQKINTIYGEEGICEPPDPAEITDETQTSVAIAEALIESGDAEIDTLMAAVTHNLIAWSNSPENTRAPGHTVTEAVRTLESGVSWREAGIAHAKGNGSAVRVAPVGYLYQRDPTRLREVAHATGIATHAHPSADAATVAAAYLIKLALDGVPPEDFVRLALDFTGSISDEFHETMLKVGHVSAWTDELAAINHIGSGWTGEEAVAIALYCVLRYPDDFVQALHRAVNISGDSDSVGSITGGLMAARLGLNAIPPAWIERLEHHKRLTDLADRLAAKKQSMYGSA